jgi:hypothetical protein
VLDLGRLVEERVDALLNGRGRGTRLVLPDDIDLLAGVAAELTLGERAGGLGLRPGGVVVGAVLAGQRRADTDDENRRDDPAEDHAAAVAVGDVG